MNMARGVMSRPAAMQAHPRAIVFGASCIKPYADDAMLHDFVGQMTQRGVVLGAIVERHDPFAPFSAELRFERRHGLGGDDDGDDISLPVVEAIDRFRRMGIAGDELLLVDRSPALVALSNVLGMPAVRFDRRFGHPVDFVRGAISRAAAHRPGEGTISRLSPNVVGDPSVLSFYALNGFAPSRPAGIPTPSVAAGMLEEGARAGCVESARAIGWLRSAYEGHYPTGMVGAMMALWADAWQN